MGPEPIMAALDLDVDGVFVGRSLDSGLFMALPLMAGIDRGIAAHFGMIMACGALAAEPGGIDLLFGEIDHDGFTVVPPNERLACTPASVAAHTLYEQPNPGLEALPGGFADTRHATYERVDDRTVRVSGSQWIEAAPYTVKLEGVSRQGARTICLAGIRDPNLISALDDFLGAVRKTALDRLGESRDVMVDFKSYGRDAVMGSWERDDSQPKEIGLLVDVVAPTQEEASAICGVIRSEILLASYPGRFSTSGNVALAFSPSEIEVGDTYTFNIWHLWPQDETISPFTPEIREFGAQ